MSETSSLDNSNNINSTIKYYDKFLSSLVHDNYNYNYNNLLEQYPDIKWTSNYSIVNKRVHSYGGIIGGSLDFKKRGRTRSTKIKTKRVYNLFFKPALPSYRYLYVDNQQLSFYNKTEPIFGKRLNPEKKKILIQTGNESLISRNMPPLVQFLGGKIHSTFNDYKTLMREWGYYIGDMKDISEYIENGKNTEIKPNIFENIQVEDFRNVKIRIRPELFTCKGDFEHITNPIQKKQLEKAYENHLISLIPIYITGIIYYNIHPQKVEQEITIQSDKIPKNVRLHLLKEIESLVKTQSGYRSNLNRLNKVQIRNLRNIQSSKSNINKLFQSNKSNVKITTFKKDINDTEFEDEMNKDYEYYSVNKDIVVEQLQNKSEFRLLQQDRMDQKTIDQLCPVNEFRKLKSQELARNFMHLDTPYRSLLIFHGLGTGKTCLAITIAETYKKFVEKTGRKIVVILSRSIYENFLKEMYNFKQEQKENKYKLERGSMQCAGDVYHTPEYLTPKERVKLRNKKVFEYYDILTYGTVKNTFEKIIRKYYPELSKGKKFKLTPQIIQKYIQDPFVIEKIRRIFNNRLIIVDEIHNMRDSLKEDEKFGSKLIEEYLKIGERNKLVLLTATPIYNQLWEITYLLNLLRMNDKQSLIPDNLFDKRDYELDDINPEKLQLLADYSRGYVSYLRGENPINFPQKVFPTHPTYFPNYPFDYSGKSYDNKMYKYRKSVIPLIHTQLNPKQLFYFKSLIFGLEINPQMEQKEERFHSRGKFISNIIFPGEEEEISFNPNTNTIRHHFDKNDKNIRYGSKGFDETFFLPENTKKTYNPILETAFVDYYIDTNNSNSNQSSSQLNKVFFLDHRVLPCFSLKYYQILQDIRSHPNDLIFIYSEYRKSGVYPICMMLEYYGYKRETIDNTNQRNLLQLEERKKDLSYMKHKTTGKSYILLEGDIGTIDRAKLVDKFNDPSNKNAEKIHIIIGTKVMGEGIDMKNIRQIHILNPWFNFSRMDQVIGRGVRHCSHINVEPSDRNVLIKIYGSSCVPYQMILEKEQRNNENINDIYNTPIILPTEINDEEPYIERETTDEYIYRLALEKDYLFQKIFKVLKKNSIDNKLNQNANYFGPKFGDKADKDYSRDCHYEKCDILNNEDNQLVNIENANKDTYNYKKTIQIIIDLQKIILKILQKNKKSFTYDELKQIIINEYRKLYNGNIPQVSLINYILQKLIKKNKLLYSYNQYVYIPKQLRHQDYYNFGLEYLNKPMLFNVQSGIELNYREKVIHIEDYLNNQTKIRKYNFIQWIKKIYSKQVEFMKLFNIQLQTFNYIFYNLFMKNEGENILYYLLNAIYYMDENATELSKIVGFENVKYLDFIRYVFDYLTIHLKAKDSKKYVFKFLYKFDSLIDTPDILIIITQKDDIGYDKPVVETRKDLLFDFKLKYEPNLIRRTNISQRKVTINGKSIYGHPYSVKLIEKRIRNNKKDLFEEFKSNFQFNQFFGYIEFDTIKKKYIFRFVNSINSKVAKATIATTGQNCETWKNTNKHEFLSLVIKEYQKLSGNTLQYNVSKIQSKDYCIYIQYFLYLCHSISIETKNDRKYFFELITI
jgi:superfamily II DNA or RNA helicase